ncbi:hypothetical protein J4467_00695 [Candidatus Woesearchaeota archaeon]|nr:hypothetical protein [Candidatus Woesearchaeota archaeon]
MRYIQAFKEKEIILGKVSYHNASQAWTIIRFKKEFLLQFPDLRNKKGDFHYELIPFLYWDELMDYLQRERAKGKVPPNLLWLKGNIK